MKINLKNINFKFDKRFWAIFISVFIVFFITTTIRWVYKNFDRVNFDEIAIVLNSGLGAGVDKDLQFQFIKSTIWRSFLCALPLAMVCQLFRFRAVLLTVYTLCLFLFVQQSVKSNIQFGSFFSFKKSNFYEQEYVNPESVQIKWSERRNVVFIALESMEKVYGTTEVFNEILMPNITKLEKENMSFENYHVIAGAGHTIAAITGFTAGLPLLFTSFRDVDKMTGAYGIGKIFRNAGYQTWTMFPATGKFSNKARFMYNMGFDNVIDGEFIRKDIAMPPKESPFQGIDDGTFFDYVKPVMKNIIKSGRPYFVFLETVNTHCEGLFTEYCKSIGFRQDSITDIIKCDDKLVYDFVVWLQKLDPSAVVILVDDHNANPKYFENEKFKDMKNRPLSNVFLNARIFNRKDKNTRLISALDFFPTTIEAAGAKIDGCRLGLGVSLSSCCGNVKTLRERFPDLDNLLEQKNDLYYNLATGRNKK